MSTWSDFERRIDHLESDRLTTAHRRRTSAQPVAAQQRSW